MTIFAIYLSLCDTDSVTINKDTSRNVQECPEPAPVSPIECPNWQYLTYYYIILLLQKKEVEQGRSRFFLTYFFS